MTMRFRTCDTGELVQAETAEELVAQLHASSLAPALDDRTWMDETAQRAHTLTGLKVRSDSADHFITDLEAAKLLEPMPLQMPKPDEVVEKTDE